MPAGQRHLVQCHCILPQYRHKKEIIFHKFEVFSIINDDDTVEEKLVNCNNCGVTHRVYDMCKSEILFNQEDSRSPMSKEDFKISLPSQIFDLLSEYKKEVCDFEQA